MLADGVVEQSHASPDRLLPGSDAVNAPRPRGEEDARTVRFLPDRLAAVQRGVRGGHQRVLRGAVAVASEATPNEAVTFSVPSPSTSGSSSASIRPRTRSANW